MRVLLAVVLVLSFAFMTGCQADKPEQTADSSEQSAEDQGAVEAAEKVENPISITPDPGPLALKDPIAEATVDVSDGVDELEAPILGGYYLRAHRETTLGDAYGETAEAFELLNQVTFQGRWLLTYSRTTVDGEPADAYAATVVLDAQTGKQLEITEAP